MFFVACSGFPIPVSRYFREFSAVEISDSELAIPGEGTVRRWKREAPEGFGFSVVAPKAFAEAGFQSDKELAKLADELVVLAKQLEAAAVVFSAPEELKFSKANKATLQAFVKSLPKKMPRVVFDLPSWKTDQILGLGEVVAAYDPLRQPAPAADELVYLRLPGPAGHRSRYDEASIERIAEHLGSLRAKQVFCVFRNIDMHANAGQILKKVK